MSKRRGGAIVSYAYTFARVTVNLVYVPVLLAGIGKSEYGLYQTIGSVIAYLNIVSNTLSAGATRYYCRFHAVGDEDGKANTLGILRRLYKVANVFIMIAAIAIMAGLRMVYRDSFSSWELDESCLMVAVLAANLMVSMNNTVAIACITAHEEFIFLKGSMLVSQLVQPLAVIALVMEWPYAITVCVAQFVVNAVLRTVQQAYAKYRLSMDSTLRFEDKGLQRGILAFSGSIVLGIVADQVFWKTDQLILAYMYGTGTVAVYGVAMQVVTIYMSVGVEVASVFMPRISELWHRDRDIEALSELFVKVGRLSLYPLMLVLTGFVVFGRDFLALWAGEGFGDAYAVALIAMVPFTVDICQHVGLTILQVMDKYSFRARMYVVAAVANVGLTIALASVFGPVGAAVSTAVSIILTSGLVMNLYYARVAGLDVGRFWASVTRQIAPLFVLCTVEMVAWGHVRESLHVGWLLLVVAILLYTILFCVVSWFMSTNGYERGIALSFFGKVLRKGGTGG